jgi:hypothetical protein
VSRRAEVEIALARNRADVVEHFAAMDGATLVRPVTRSGVDPDFWWRPLDHLSHLILVERNMNKVVRAHLDGAPEPVRAVIPALPTREATMVFVDDMNDEFARRYLGAALGDVLRDGEAALAETYSLLAEVADERLDEQMPGVPWSGGTISGVLTHNAGDHFRRHRGWIDEGLAAT